MMPRFPGIIEDELCPARFSMQSLDAREEWRKECSFSACVPPIPPESDSSINWVSHYNQFVVDFP